MKITDVLTILAKYQIETEIRYDYFYWDHYLEIRSDVSLSQRIKMSEKKHRNVIIIFGILHAIVSEILNYAETLLIMESVVVINFIQVMVQGEFIHDIPLFDSPQIFLKFNVLALVVTMCITFIRWVLRKADYFGLRVFTILMCYAIALFYGNNNTNPYGSMKLDVIACVLLALFILREVLSCLYSIDWGEIRMNRKRKQVGKEEKVMNVEIEQNENMEERLAAYAEKVGGFEVERNWSRR